MEYQSLQSKLRLVRSPDAADLAALKRQLVEKAIENPEVVEYALAIGAHYVPRHGRRFHQAVIAHALAMDELLGSPEVFSLELANEVKASAALLQLPPHLQSMASRLLRTGARDLIGVVPRAPNSPPEGAA